MAPKLPKRNTDPSQLGIKNFFARRDPNENIAPKLPDSLVHKSTIKRAREGDGNGEEKNDFVREEFKRKSAKLEVRFSSFLASGGC